MSSTRIGRVPILSIVLAGGEGKRLMPLTTERAKPAVPFGAKYRLIDFAVSNLVNGGFRHIVVLTQYKSHSLDVHISLTWQLSTLLGNYVTTVPAQMRRGERWFTGSADALYQNFNLLDDEQPEHVIVFGADHIYRLDPRQMLDYHIQQGAGVTVAGIRVPAEEAFQFGVIEKDNNSPSLIRAFHEKNPDAPRLEDSPDQVLASMGNYIFSAEVFRQVMTEDAKDPNSSHDVGGDIIPKLVAAGQAHVYDYTTNVIPGQTGDEHYWRDVGTLDSYFDAHMDLVAPWPKFSLYNSQWPIFTRGVTEPPAKVADGPSGPSNISNSILSSGVIVSGSTVSESVLSSGATVTGASVHQSVLLDGVKVEAGAKLRRCIIDKNVTVPAGVEIGYDREADERRFTVSESGVVAIGKGTVIDPAG